MIRELILRGAAVLGVVVMGQTALADEVEARPQGDATGAGRPPDLRDPSAAVGFFTAPQ